MREYSGIIWRSKYIDVSQIYFKFKILSKLINYDLNELKMPFCAVAKNYESNQNEIKEEIFSMQ